MRKQRGYWDKERVFEEARKFKTRNEFKKGSKYAYNKSLKHGWMNDYHWFVDGRTKLFVDKIDSVYKYVFSDGAIYVGRTLMNRQNDRHNEHKTDTDTVGKYAKANGLEVPQMIIIEDNLTLKEGLEREDYWVNYYKDNSYKVINKAKTGIGCGALGAINKGKWNKKDVFEEAKKYKTRTEFAKGSCGAYNAAWKKGWLSEMDWFKELCKPNGYWDKETVFEEALKYKTRTEFQKGSPRAYDVARRKGWIKEMDWFDEVIKPSGYWNNFENCYQEGLKYKTRGEFARNAQSAYQVAWKNNWLDILFPAKKVA